MNPTFYFLLALTAVLAAATANAGGPVLDIDGNMIFDGSYYVIPVIRRRGGGLTFSGRSGQLCPLDIVQETSVFDEGIPVIFSNWRSRVGFVPESENLNIKMDVAATICFQSTYWWVDALDEVTRKFFIIAGPNPDVGGDSLKSFFQIVKYRDDDYKFVFCPVACAGSSKLCRPNCFDLGFYVDITGVRHLVLSDEPFLVRFKKANVNETSSKTMSLGEREREEY